jgi:predicted Zn-dependent protease
MTEYDNHQAYLRAQSLKRVAAIGGIGALLLGAMFLMKQDGRGHFLQKASTEELLKEYQAEPTDEELALFLGKKLITDGRYDKAFDVMSRLTKQKDNSAPIWKGYAMAAAGSGHVIAAMQANLKVAELAPPYPMGHATAGTILIQAGLIDEGLEEIQKAKTLQPDVRFNISVYAQALASRGRYTEAYDALRSSLDVDPTQDSLYEYLAQLAPRVGKFEDASGIMLTRIKLSPMYDLYAVRAPLSALLLSYARDKQALEHALYYAQAAAKCGLPKAQVPVAKAYIASSNTAEALRAVQSGLKQDPKDRDCLAMLAEIKDLEGNHVEAAEIRSRLGELSPAENKRLTQISAAAYHSADKNQKLQAARQLTEKGWYAEAAELYRQLGDSSNYDACRRQALEKLEAKELAEARSSQADAAGH